MNNTTTVLSSTADTAVNSTELRITPTNALSPINEQGVKLLINSETPAAGAALPVTVFFNSTAVPVYDKYGNIVYGNQIYKGIVLKGYYGNNGSGNTAHYQLLKLPVRICYCGGLA
jgi:hypothetical protein